VYSEFAQRIERLLAIAFQASHVIVQARHAPGNRKQISAKDRPDSDVGGYQKIHVFHAISRGAFAPHLPFDFSLSV
jgi:hypothetical protein